MRKEYEIRNDLECELSALMAGVSDDKFRANWERINRLLVELNACLSTKWLIWSNEHMAWWAPRRSGYVEDRNSAGTYTYDEAANIVAEANRHLDPTKVPHEAMVKY